MLTFFIPPKTLKRRGLFRPCRFWQLSENFEASGTSWYLTDKAHVAPPYVWALLFVFGQKVHYSGLYAALFCTRLKKESWSRNIFNPLTHFPFWSEPEKGLSTFVIVGVPMRGAASSYLTGCSRIDNPKSPHCFWVGNRKNCSQFFPS